MLDSSSEKKTGWRKFFNNPIIYEFTQNFLSSNGHKRIWDLYCSPNDWLKNTKVLDIGCGTGLLLKYVREEFEYIGYDIDQTYINFASKRFKGRPLTDFRCKYFDAVEAQSLVDTQIDLIYAFGLLHHCSDTEAKHLFEICYSVLNNGGKIITVDPCKLENQYFLARYLINRDRGQNIRYPHQYLSLAKDFDFTFERYIHHNLLKFPYDHCVMVLTK